VKDANPQVHNLFITSIDPSDNDKSFEVSYTFGVKEKNCDKLPLDIFVALD